MTSSQTPWYTVVGKICSWVAYPVLILLYYILKFVRLLLSPLVYLAVVAKEILLWPMQVFMRYETIFYFFGTAMVLGIIAALVLHATLRTSVVVFDLDQKPAPPPVPATGHDAASYRAAREAKKAKAREARDRRTMQARLMASQPLIQEVVREARKGNTALSSMSPLSPNTSTAATRSGLFRETILEHTDEEEESAF